MWIDFFLQEVNGVSQIFIGLDFRVNFVDGIYDSGMVLSSKSIGNADLGDIRDHIPAEIHGNLSWKNVFIVLLAAFYITLIWVTFY